MRRLALLAAALWLSACASVRPAGRARRGVVIPDAPLTFTFVDMGQADALLVKFRDRVMLVDAGESRSLPDAHRSRALAARIQQLTGKRHVDLFVATHYHRDHVGNDGPDGRTGMFELVADEGLTVGTLVDRGEFTVGDKGATQRLWEKAVAGWLAAGRVKAHHVAAVGEHLDLGEGLTVEVVAANANGRFGAPDEELRAWPPSENDYSVALKFTYGDFELFTGGDLTGETVHRTFGLVQEGDHDVEGSTAARVGDVEVYRANHHGSPHSTNPCLVATLRPEVSIISSGENNYGHPSVDVVKALRRHGPVFITSGADARVRGEVAGEIVGGDVDIQVAADGRRYAVNGWGFRSRTEEEEAQAAPPSACIAGEWRGERPVP